MNGAIKTEGTFPAARGALFTAQETQGLGQTFTLTHPRKRLELLSKRGSPRGRLIPPNIWRNLSQCLTTHPRAQRPFGLRKGGWINSAAVELCLKPLELFLLVHILISSTTVTDYRFGIRLSGKFHSFRNQELGLFGEVPKPGVSHSEPR